MDIQFAYRSSARREVWTLFGLTLVTGFFFEAAAFGQTSDSSVSPNRSAKQKVQSTRIRSQNDEDEDRPPKRIPAERSTAERTAASDEPVAKSERMFLELTNATFGDVASQMRSVFIVPANSKGISNNSRVQPKAARRITISENPSNSGVYQLKQTRLDKTLEITLDRRRNGIALSGDRRLMAQFQQFVRAIDEDDFEDGDKPVVLPIHDSLIPRVRQIETAVQSEPRTSLLRPKSTSIRKGTDKSSVQNAAFSDDRDGFGVIRLMANQETSSAETSGDTESGEGFDSEKQGLEQKVRKLGADLEVEVLPDLDAVILRGNKSDVREMKRILEEIERLSQEAEPTIEIYTLQHVRGESLSILIDKVNTDLTGVLRGRVTVTPLVKPNALLIIGWGDSVKSVKQLIEQLDQPVRPDAQFQVFRLKHADAQLTRTTIQDFFSGRTGGGTATGPGTNAGLSARVQITADIRTNSLIISAAPRDLREAAELIREIDAPRGEVVHQARVFKLKNTLASDLATIIQSAVDAARGKEGTSVSSSTKASLLEFMSIDKEGNQVLKSGVLADVKITAEPHTNSLLVSASTESMELIAALIKRLDEASSEGAQIKVFRIINGDATSLVQMLRSLLPPANGPLGSPQLANSRDGTALVPARFTVDLRTNSIIATGSVGDLKIVEALLLRLDQKDVEQRKNTVYRLKNAPANAVAKSVNDFLRSERTVQQAAPGAISPFQQIESEVVVVPEPVGNSLIISATPRFFDDIEKLVEKLDAQPPQVMIQVLIAQITLNNLNEFGVELGLQDALLFDRSLLGNLVSTTSSNSISTPSGITSATNTNILGATNTPGFAFNGAPLGNSGSPNSLATAANVAGQAVSNFGVGSVNNQLGYGGLVLSASSESVSVLIRALQQSSRLEVLSRPQVRTLDNQPAFIQIGQRVPRVSQSQVNQIGAVNGITLENVGLILAVTPRISPDGMVVMEVDAEKSEVDQIDTGIPISVSNSGTVIRSPLFNITTASTTVSANSGETIILGGLITKSTNDITRRVPLLADIPLLGNLFRYDSTQTTRTELLIILTPYVIRGPEESARIKREEIAKMHWCAGDVIDIHGPGIIDDDRTNIPDIECPVIYPDSNPRGTISPIPELSPPPAPSEIDAARGQIGAKETESRPKRKKKASSLTGFWRKSE